MNAKGTKIKVEARKLVTLKRFILGYGNWNEIMVYYHQTLLFIGKVYIYNGTYSYSSPWKKNLNTIIMCF